MRLQYKNCRIQQKQNRIQGGSVANTRALAMNVKKMAENFSKLLGTGRKKPKFILKI